MQLLITDSITQEQKEITVTSNTTEYLIPAILEHKELFTHVTLHRTKVKEDVQALILSAYIKGTTEHVYFTGLLYI